MNPAVVSSCGFLPQAVRKSLFYRSLKADSVKAWLDLAEDQDFIREELRRKKLAAFVADGAILPRESGISGRPMKGAVPFDSPESSALFEAVMALPANYRSVIHLFYYEDYSINEIAALLGISENTVKSQLFRGRTLLKKRLKEGWDND